MEKFLLKILGNIIIGIAYITSVYPILCLIIDQPINSTYTFLNFIVCYLILGLGICTIPNDKNNLPKHLNMLGISYNIGLCVYWISILGVLEVILYGIFAVILQYAIKAIFEATLNHIENNIKQAIKEDSEIQRHLHLTIDKNIKNNRYLTELIEDIAYRCINDNEITKNSLTRTNN